jgi:MFS family permease
MITNFKLIFKTFPTTLWFVLAAIFINQVGMAAFPFLLLYLTKSIGLPLAKASTAYIAYGISLITISLFGGVIIDYFGAHRVQTISLFANGLVLLFYPMTHTYWTILLMSLLWGLTTGLYRPASQTVISFLAPTGVQKIAFSMQRFANNLGMSIAPLMGAYLAEKHFSLIFNLNGFSSLLASLMVLTIFSFMPLDEKSTRLKNKFRYSIFSVLKQDQLLCLFLLALTPIMMVFFQSESTLAIFLNTTLGLPLKLYGTLFTINTLLIISFELALNIHTQHWSHYSCILIGAALITIGFGGYLFVHSYWQVVFMTVVWTFGEMFLLPASNTYVAERASKDKRGTYLALYSLVFNIGLLLGPCSGAIIIHYYGTYSVWWMCGILGLLATIVMFFLFRWDDAKCKEVMPIT